MQEEIILDQLGFVGTAGIIIRTYLYKTKEMKTIETKNLLQSNWLNADNTQDLDKVVVLDEGELETKEGKLGPYEQLILNVDYKTQHKKLGLNRQSHKAVAEKHGTDTVAWVGKILVLRHIPDKVVEGKLRNKLFVMPME